MMNDILTKRDVEIYDIKLWAKGLIQLCEREKFMEANYQRFTYCKMQKKHVTGKNGQTDIERLPNIDERDI